MPYREEEDALRARIDGLEQEASAEHAENERLRADLARANAKLARDEPRPARSEQRSSPSRLRVIAIVLGIFGAVVALIVVATWNDGVHGTIISEGGKLGTWQAALTKCESRGGRFDGINFFDRNGVTRARVIVDAKGDASVWVYKDDAKNWGYRADRPDCTTLDAKLTQTNRGSTRADFDGSVAFDCKLANGRVHGALTFKGCY